jgi:unsaturated rhamnogalacturonyl hydrolase
MRARISGRGRAARRLALSLAAGLCAQAAPARAQDATATVRALRAVADGVLRDAAFDFVDSATGRRYAAAEAAPAGARLRLGSAYNDWRYWNGVLNLALWRLSDALGDPRYFAFAERNIAFAFDNVGYFEARHGREDKWSYPLGQLFTMEDLDDYGAEGAVTAGMLSFRSDERWRRYVERAADYLAVREGRLPDGTLARPVPRRWTVWADDLFMSVPLLLNQYARTGEARWLEDAERQVIAFHRYLFDERAGLMHHNWYSDSARAGVAFWGRANGWALLAEVAILDRLPPADLAHDTLLALFRRHVEGITRYQDGATGLWHQLLDKPDSYLETSASAMFTFAIAHGVRQRYLAPSYADVARRGWNGVLSRVRPDGKIEGTCAGTDVSDDLADYYARPTPLNDPHGVGPVLLAGAEILKLRR